MRKIAVISISLMVIASQAMGAPPRYFYVGDGRLAIQGGNKKLQKLSGRLIALLDYLQDQLTQGKGEIEILSGYRDPQYNENLRRQGRLAAKASLHMEGMAADFILKGVGAKKIWEYVRALNCCGIGYYHGNAVHIDTGPARFWDETTSKVFTDISTHNKQIYLTTEYDRYQPGEKLQFKWVRVTEYPFGFQNKIQILRDKKPWKSVELPGKNECLLVKTREEAQKFSFVLPEEATPPGEKLQIRAKFCEKPAQEMPDELISNSFIIASPSE